MGPNAIYSLEEVLVARLNPGESLVDEIEKFVREKNVRAGVILSVVGTTRQLVLRNPKPGTTLPLTDETEQSTQTETYIVDRPLEIVTAEGNIFEKDGQIGVHMHICCSQDGGRMYGGHLFRATLWSQAEVVIGKLKGPTLDRKFDKATGLYQLNIDGKDGDRR